MTETKKKRIGEILIEDGVLSPQSLEEALNLQKKEGGLIGQILIRQGYVSEEQVIAAASKQLKIPYIPLANYSINPDTAIAFGKDFCRTYLVLPFDQDEKNIFLAMGDPLNDLAVSEIQKKCNLKPQIFIATPSEILSMMELIFKAAAPVGDCSAAPVRDCSAAKNEVKKAG